MSARNILRRALLKATIRTVHKHFAEGVVYDPERKIYIWRWTEALEKELFKNRRYRT